MTRFKRLPGEPNIFRIPRRYGPAPPEECPLNGGEEVPFMDCLECEYYVDFDTHEYSHCGIKEEEEKRRRAKEMEEERREQERFDREIAERDARRAKDDRTMREEMAELRDKQKKNAKKWQKEYEMRQEVTWDYEDDEEVKDEDEEDDDLGGW